MPIESYIWYRCRCEVLPAPRLLCKSPRDRGDSPRRIASAESNPKIPSLYDRYGGKHFDMNRTSGIKCASCTAAAAAAARRERGARYRRLDDDAEEKRTLAENTGRGDKPKEVDRGIAYKTPRTSAEEAVVPQDQSGEGEEETNDEDYNSDDTITKPRYIYSDYNPNEFYGEREEQQSSSQDSQDSNAERINHDERRWSPPGRRVPCRGNETPSTASESQSSADVDDEEAKEAAFRERADRKYLLGLRLQEERFLG